MAKTYSNYTLQDIATQFSIVNKRQMLFSDVESVESSDWLKNSLQIAQELPIKSEKARSELIVTPILLELRNRNEKFFTIYSGDTLNADEEKGLKGECDFILAKDTGSFDINIPIIQVVEAKKNDIEIGIPQCAAQMVGANVFNQKKGVELPAIYGCVTTGDDWLFMKLEGSQILIDIKKYYLGDVPELLGVFQYIISFYRELTTEKETT